MKNTLKNNYYNTSKYPIQDNFKLNWSKRSRIHCKIFISFAFNYNNNNFVKLDNYLDIWIILYYHNVGLDVASLWSRSASMVCPCSEVFFKCKYFKKRKRKEKKRKRLESVIYFINIKNSQPLNQKSID